MKHTDRFSWQILTLTYQHINKVLYSNIWTARLLCKILCYRNTSNFQHNPQVPSILHVLHASVYSLPWLPEHVCIFSCLWLSKPLSVSCGSSCCLMTAVPLELDFSSHRPVFVLQIRPRHNGRVSSLSQETTSEMCHQMRQNVKYSLSKQLANLQPCSLLTNQPDMGVPHLCFFWIDGF